MNSQGFTLVETAIAIAVLGLILIGVMVGNTVLQQNSEAAFERTRALQDANQVLESMRKTAMTGNFPDNVTAAYSGTLSGYTSLPGEIVTVAYTDSNGDGNAANDNPLDVTVTVSWLQNGLRIVNTPLRALVAKHNH